MVEESKNYCNKPMSSLSKGIVNYYCEFVHRNIIFHNGSGPNVNIDPPFNNNNRNNNNDFERLTYDRVHVRQSRR